MPETVQNLQALFDKLNVKVTTDEGTKEVNLFSDPILLYKFMKFVPKHLFQKILIFFMNYTNYRSKK